MFELLVAALVDEEDFGAPAPEPAVAPGKRTLTARLRPRGAAPVQADRGLDDARDVHRLAAAGVSGPAGALPHLAAIQAAFGRHDVAAVRAHVGGAAAEASAAIGAGAYAMGGDVAFAAAPDLHQAAHEAAHVIQQRAGVSLDGGVGRRGDRYERHADEVADRVVRGESAEPLLDAMAPAGAGAASSIANAVQRADAPAAPAAPGGAALEQLVADARAATPSTAPQVLARIASYQPLADAVARLDAEQVLDPMLGALAGDAWTGPARAPMLAILAARTPAQNAATLRRQAAAGLLDGDRRITGEDVRLAYELLRALPPADRDAFLASPEGKLAFERVPERKRPALRFARELAFYDEDVDAVVAALEPLEAWAPAQEPWLRVLFWMVVQGGLAADPRVVAFVKHNWDGHGDFFASVGLRADGKPTMQELRATPDPRTVAFKLNGFGAVFPHDKLGTLGVTFNWLLPDAFGKRSTIEHVPVVELQRLLGGTLFGLHLDDDGADRVTGEVALQVAPSDGLLVIDLPKASIPTVSWSGPGKTGPLSVTGRALTMTGLHAESRWPAGGTLATQERLHLTLGSMSATSVVALANGVESARIDGLSITAIEFDADLGPYRDGDGVRIFRMPAQLGDQLESIALVAQAAVGALVSTIATSARPEDLIADLHAVLATKFGGELRLKATVGNVTGKVTLPAGSVGVDTGFELVVAAGPRALAELEIGRLLAKQEAGPLDATDQARLTALQAVAVETDRAEADEALRKLAIDPAKVVLELDTSGAPGAAALRLTGLELPGAKSTFEEIAGEGAKVTVTIPPGATPTPAPGATPTPAPGAADPARPLATVELDLRRAVVRGADTGLAGDPATAGPLVLTDVHGTATVLPDHRVTLDVTVADVSCDHLRWGNAVLDAAGGRAASVHATGTVRLTDDGTFAVDDGSSLVIEILGLTAPQATIDNPGKYHAVAQHPTFVGLRVTLAGGVLPNVKVAGGSVTGFAAALAGLFHGTSDSPATFVDFNLDADVVLGTYKFRFGDLEAHAVDTKLAGPSLMLQYFDGPLAGTVREDRSGEVDLTAAADFKLGALALHLGAVADSLAPVDLRWATASMPGAALTLAWAFPAPDRMSVTLRHLEAPVAIITGFGLDTVLARGAIAISMTPLGQARLFDLEIPSFTLVLGEDFVAPAGDITAATMVSAGVEATIGPFLQAHLAAASGPLAIAALADGTQKFTLADLDVHGDAVVLRGGAPLREWKVFVHGDASGTIDDDGLDVELDHPQGGVDGERGEADRVSGTIDRHNVSVRLGGGRYDNHGLHVTFDRVQADVFLGQPGDPTAAPPGLQLESLVHESQPIVWISAVQLDGAHFVIDDLGALIGRPELVTLFPTLQTISDHLHGTVGFRMLSSGAAPHVQVDTTIDAGHLNGTLTPTPPLPIVPFTGRLFPALTGGVAGAPIQMHLAHVDTLWGSIPIEFPPADPLALDVPGPVDFHLDGIDQVKVAVHLEPTSIDVPGVGSLHLAAASTMAVEVTGSTDHGLGVELAVPLASARALVWESVDLAVSGIHLDRGADLQVEMNGLAVRRVEGTIVSGSIDVATLGTFEK